MLPLLLQEEGKIKRQCDHVALYPNVILTKFYHVVGIVYAFIYYFVFRWYLTKNNISVDVSDDDDETDSSVSVDEKMQKTASVIIEGLGGYDNITAVNNCISRLRVDVKDMNKVSDEMLKKTGSLGIIKPSETHIQVIYGPKVEQVADAVRQVMKMYE